MANDISAILPTIYRAADTVSREFIGFVGASFRNSEAEGAAVGQTITYPVVPAMAAGNVSASNVLPAGTDQTLGSGSMTISKSRSVSWPSTGEEQVALRTGDKPMGGEVLEKQFVQAMRTLVNELESDAFLEAYKNSSRAYGTAGTTPFGTAADFSDFAGVARILDENGAPPFDRGLVLGHAAIANVRGKQSSLFKANEAGTDELLRRGLIASVMGFNLHTSHAISTHTKGTGASATTTNAGHAAGATTVNLASAGTGTIVAGDVITIATENAGYNFVVNVGDADVSDGGTVVIGQPGLKVAIGASARAITVGNNYVPNIAFHRDAFHIITRVPAMPEGGDAADDVANITDPNSGLSFQVAIYRERRQVVYEVGLAWGVKAVKEAHIATLMG